MDKQRLDDIIARGQRERVARERGYREQALRLFPWVCGRCQREFSRTTVQGLTVHHRDHDHHNNPPDGSNWELLCVYCHDNEHSRELDSQYESDTGSPSTPERGSHKGLAGLGDLFGRGDD